MSQISPTCSRKLAAQDTRNNIINAYSSLVKTKGIENITIREICKEAGVSNGGFYNHFSTKDDVLRAWYLRFTTGIAERISKSGAASEKEEILIYFDGYAELNMQLGTQFCRHFYVGSNSFLAEQDHESLDVIYRITRRFLENKGLEERYSPELVIRYFLIISRGTMLEWGVKNGDFDAKKRLNTLIKIAIDAIEKGIYELAD